MKYSLVYIDVTEADVVTALLLCGRIAAEMLNSDESDTSLVTRQQLALKVDLIVLVMTD